MVKICATQIKTISQRDNVLMYAQRVIVPTTLQKEFHMRHPGILKMKILTRSYEYWPTMNCDIEELEKVCR